MIDFQDQTRIFVTSDLHFGHKNVMTFSPERANACGSTDIKVHDEYLVKILNETGSSCEHSVLICLGDVALSTKAAARNMSKVTTFEKKILILGNHDNASESFYREACGFDMVLPMLVRYGLLFSHYPVHPHELAVNGNTSGWGRYIGNVHGHIHNNKIEDPRYMCVCVEHTQLRPIRLDKIIQYYNNLYHHCEEE